MPCDYYFSGYKNETVYREPPNTTAELNAKLTHVVASIDEDSLKTVYKTLE